MLRFALIIMGGLAFVYIAGFIGYCAYAAYRDWRFVHRHRRRSS